MIVAIYGSRRQEENIEAIQNFFETLEARGVEIIMHRNLYNSLLQLMPTALQYVRRVVDNDYFEADVAVSFGGDGTFLRTAMWVGDKYIPIVGINTGHLGYLTGLSLEQLPGLLDMLAGDYFRIESRGLIYMEEPYCGPRFYPYALNEFALMKEESASMVAADVAIGGVDLGRYRADGLLVCTATGSTAYNLSVGGPIVQPTVDVHVIAPVAAHSLSMRPLVVDSHSTITIVPSGRATRVRIALDGRSTEVDMGTRITLVKAPFKVRVLRPADQNFADALREKLHWGSY